jgi:hypothetical protein
VSDLADELRDHIFAVYRETPVAQRRASRWVMDPEWLPDLRAIDTAGPAWPETLLGLPLDIREGGGPPHLEPAS